MYGMSMLNQKQLPTVLKRLDFQKMLCRFHLSIGMKMSSFKKVANIEASFDDYVNVDNGVQTWDNPSEEDILNSIFESRGVPAEPDNDEHDLTVEKLAETEEALPTLIQAASSISVIRTFVEMRSDVPINVFNSLHDLEAFIENEKWKTVIQTKLTDYFK
ncbi:uncharacterized protein LOC128862338 [Anastrepha ludens]|uniref:uncharacterized protein LOC128862338 n=1 Tax=Anastrepha ludens TaxID=28586 RepID=UPI0023AF7D8B|nr:uncharacterized protein LOC128862338 [Anastrepha ludens]